MAWFSVKHGVHLTSSSYFAMYYEIAKNICITNKVFADLLLTIFYISNNLSQL